MTRPAGSAATIRACYLGYIVQAVVNNFAPLLFLTFARDYGLGLEQITLITTLNFSVQLLVDLFSTRLIDAAGVRRSVVAAHVFAALGIAGMAVFPALAPEPYPGLLCAAALYAVGGGLIEVLVSPIVESCPTERKEAAMSLLHSFYCWGHVGVVLASAAFFALFGTERWRVLALLWALLPAANAVNFARVPLYPIAGGREPMSLGTLLRQKVLWLLLVLMLCAGAAEQAMSQWASTFAESALHVTKAAGDLAGPCAFALLMGTSRALYARFSQRLPLRRAILGSAGLCILCYLLAALSGSPLLSLAGCALCGFSVGVFWPGVFSMAAARLPAGGAAMYALMALAGDLGCASGPTLVGFAAAAQGGELRAGLIWAIAFPAVLLAGVLRLGRPEQI